VRRALCVYALCGCSVCAHCVRVVCVCVCVHCVGVLRVCIV